jgi:hypothetical protein
MHFHVIALALTVTPLLLLPTPPAVSPKGAMVAVLASDPRNAGLEMSAYWESLFSSDAIIVSIDGLSNPKAPADILRVLYQFASRISDEDRFKVVKLAKGGKVRFLLDGDYFRQVGREYSAGQNPVYLMRTLPQNVHELNGQAAFSTWSGGMIGVVGRQMDDLNAFINRWLAN